MTKKRKISMSELLDLANLDAASSMGAGVKSWDDLLPHQKERYLFSYCVDGLGSFSPHGELVADLGDIGACASFTALSRMVDWANENQVAFSAVILGQHIIARPGDDKHRLYDRLSAAADAGRTPEL